MSKNRKEGSNPHFHTVVSLSTQSLIDWQSFKPSSKLKSEFRQVVNEYLIDKTGDQVMVVTLLKVSSTIIIPQHLI